MNTQPQEPNAHVRTRGALWASTAFYLLIAFEFFYMASPFAAYLYAVYGPGLDWLQGSPWTSWTVRFFLPHVVSETRSAFIDAHETIGFVLFGGGVVGFAIGAFQVYRAKLKRSDAVMGGLYRYIRHPQYLALIVASIGMVFVWPRYLVLVATVTVIFIYIGLAKVEERICLGQFPGYADYMRRTGPFLPRQLSPRWSLPARTRPVIRVAAWLVAYAAVLGVALILALGLRAHALSSFYRIQANNDVYLSVVEASNEDLQAVAALARSTPGAQTVLAERDNLLNYVVPVGMYISEIPMRLPPGEHFSHDVPANRDPALYKVIFTEPAFGGDGTRPEGNLLWHAVNKTPLLEVHVDLRKGLVVATFPPPTDPFYAGRQVPVF